MNTPFNVLFIVGENKNVQGGIGKDLIISAPPFNTENEGGLKRSISLEHVLYFYVEYKKAMQK